LHASRHPPDHRPPRRWLRLAAAAAALAEPGQAAAATGPRATGHSEL